jgi:hypothetical protein
MYLKKLLYLAGYLLAVYFLLPLVGEDYQFLFKVFVISLPILFGASELEEVQEGYQSNHIKDVKSQLPKAHGALDDIYRLSSKITAQLVDLDTKSTLALVYNDGTIEFINTSQKKIEKKKTQNMNPKKKSKQKNWYNELSLSSTSPKNKNWFQQLDS